MKKIFIGFLICLIASCVETAPKDIEELEINTPTSKLDTFISKGNQIIFFKPTEKEYNDLIDSLGFESGLSEVDSDFGYYANEFIKQSGNKNYDIQFVEEQIIEIIAFDGTSSYLDRINNGSHLYGVILNSDSVEPRIEFGVFSTIGLETLTK